MAKNSIIQLIKELTEHSGFVAEVTYDGHLLTFANQEMSKKLYRSREKGRGGWWDKEQCSIEDLKIQLELHIEKGDYIDVANFAAMIAAREAML